MAGIAGTYQQRRGAAVTSALGDAIGHRGAARPVRWSRTDGQLEVHMDIRPDVGDDPGSTIQFRHGLVVALDGRLYNAKELRASLTSGGAHFTTGEDAEVALEAWWRWGVRCLTRFRGMFALVVLDRAAGSLYLARDQIGLKPMHYLVQSGGVLFASELKAMLAAAGPNLHLDPGALIASMIFQWVPDQQCSVDEVVKLQPGTWVEFRPDRSVRLGRYWDPAEAAAAAAAQVVPAAALVEALVETVERHLPDGRAVHVLERGDVAGTALASLVDRLAPHRLHDAGDVLDLRDLDRPDPWATLSAIVNHLDEPMGAPSALGAWLACQRASSAGADFAFSAAAAPELLGGTPAHAACVVETQRSPAGIAARWPLPEAVLGRSSTNWDPEDLAAMVGEPFAICIGEALANRLEIYADSDLLDAINRMCLTASRTELTGLHLPALDRAGAALGLDVRMPFADVAIFRAAFATPRELKVPDPDGRPTWVGSVHTPPGEPTEPSIEQVGSLLIREWTTGALNELIEDVLPSGRLVGAGILLRQGVKSLITEVRAGRTGRCGELWHLVCTELWVRKALASGANL